VRAIARDTGRHAHPHRPEPRKPVRREARHGHHAPAAHKRTSPEKEKAVIADAVRLLGWGRKWHELADAISRMAGRPPMAEIRRILREHKAAIDKQVARNATREESDQ
jgi:hypothetical protein